MLRQEILADSPLGYWVLDKQASGTATINNSSLGSNTYNASFGNEAQRRQLGRAQLMPGAAIRSLGTESVSGATVQGCQFSGQTSWSAITVEAVIRPLSSSGYQATTGCDVSGTLDWTGCTLYQVWNGTMYPAFRIIGADNHSKDAYSSVAMSVGTAYHLLGRYNGTHVSVWLNGVKRGETAYNGGMAATGTGWFWLAGYANHSIGDYGYGEISDVAYYTTALSDARILDHYNACIESKSLAGRARDGNGAAASSVVIRDSNGYGYEKTVTPATDGAWSASVPPGTYYIIAYKTGFRPSVHGPVTAV